MNRELFDCLGVLVSDGGVVGVVGGAVVEQKNLINLVPNLLRDAIKGPVEFVDGVVRNDENADALLAHGDTLSDEIHV